MQNRIMYPFVEVEFLKKKTIIRMVKHTITKCLGHVRLYMQNTQYKHGKEKYQNITYKMNTNVNKDITKLCSF